MEYREEDCRAEVYEKALQTLEADLSGLFTYVERRIRGFKRDTYKSSFESYQAEFQGVWKALYQAAENGTDREAVCRRLAGMLITAARDVLSQDKSRVNKERNQLNMNMYMVTYALPAILSVDGGKLRDLADEISREWAEAFKNSNIQAADYETLNSGFKRSLCYITTAVCEGLNKPEDCHELQVLRDYRDHYLSGTREGRALIDEYYNIAPTIVKRIERSRERDSVYKALWTDYIGPCVSMIEEDKKQQCKEKYMEMVRRLQGEYM